MMRYLVMLNLLVWVNTTWAVPLTDIINAGSFTTSDGLTFSNFQASLSYNVPAPPTVEGFVSTRQATLADLQLTPIAGGFQVTGFAWDGTVASSSPGVLPSVAPFTTRLALTYTVTGLGGENRFGEGPQVSAGTFAPGGFDFTNLTATAPTGEQAIISSCPLHACPFPIAFLPHGTTEATVRESISISPNQNCAPDFSRCGGFSIGGGPFIPTPVSTTFFQAAPIPEPSTWLLLASGLALLLLLRNNLSHDDIRVRGIGLLRNKGGRGTAIWGPRVCCALKKTSFWFARTTCRFTGGPGSPCVPCKLNIWRPQDDKECRYQECQKQFSFGGQAKLCAMYLPLNLFGDAY
jgi:hypothetical protein